MHKSMIAYPYYLTFFYGYVSYSWIGLFDRVGYMEYK